MLSVSVIAILVYKKMASNDAIISSMSTETFLMLLKNVVEFLALLLLFLTKVLRMLAMYLSRLYNGNHYMKQ